MPPFGARDEGRRQGGCGGEEAAFPTGAFGSVGWSGLVGWCMGSFGPRGAGFIASASSFLEQPQQGQVFVREPFLEEESPLSVRPPAGDSPERLRPSMGVTRAGYWGYR